MTGNLARLVAVESGSPWWGDRQRVTWRPLGLRKLRGATAWGRHHMDPLLHAAEPLPDGLAVAVAALLVVLIVAMPLWSLRRAHRIAAEKGWVLSSRSLTTWMVIGAAVGILLALAGGAIDLPGYTVQAGLFAAFMVYVAFVWLRNRGRDNRGIER